MVIQRSSISTLKNIFIIFTLSLIIGSIKCNSCNSNKQISNSDCFNDIIQFDQDKYRAGHACVTKEGDLLIEYSIDDDSSIRLFYGLKSNGRNYFDGNSFIKIIELGDDEGVRPRYESMNRLIKINDGTNNDKEYLLSISTYRTLVELYDLSTFNFVKRNSIQYIGHQIFSFHFPILEKIIGGNYYYFCAFSHSVNFLEDGVLKGFEEGNSSTIIKFSFSSLAFDKTKLTSQTIEEINFSERIISSFIIDELNYIAVIFVKERSSSNKFMIHFFDFNLAKKNDYDIELLNISPENLYKGHGVYYKAIYLKEYYFVFIYYLKREDPTSFNFKLIQLYINNDLSQFNEIISKTFTYSLTSNYRFNDFIKYDDNRLVYITDSGTDNFCILLFSLSDDYTKMKTRYFSYSLNNYKVKQELSAYFWNNYLLFTPTYETTTNGDTKSLLLIFGFANGTDFIMDISPHLMDTGYYNNGNDLVTRLLQNLTIDNNIFGYKSTGEIKLNYIPEELLFYKSDETPLSNGCIINKNHLLKQNRNKLKTDRLYSLHYQYIIKGTEADLDSMTHDTQTDTGYSKSFEDIIFFGRMNILQFKLCHKFCETCIEFGLSNNEQICVTCKSDYTYDYLTYVKNFTGNCVPYGYMYDKESRELKTCESDIYKYYFNTSRDNIKYCFKYDYVCPDVYPYLNTTTNECLNYTVPTTIISTIPTIETSIISTLTKNIETSIASTLTKNIETSIASTLTKNIETSFITTIPKDIRTTYISDTLTNKPSSLPLYTSILLSSSTKIIDEDKCLNGTYITDLCSNITDEELYSRLRTEMFNEYNSNNEARLYKGKSEYIFRVSNTINEMSDMNSSNGVALIDLGYCETLLKVANNISLDSELIILKKEKIEINANDKDLQYNIYNPITYEELDLSICDNTTINIYIPLLSTEKNKLIYDNIIDQGYNPYDLNDKFYREICTPYDSENGTDVLLDDREEFYYSSIEEQMSCPENCSFLAYISDKKYINCECGKMITKTTLDLKHISKKNILQSFLSTFKSSNYKVMRCYNLVFNFKIFIKNYGSIFILLLFIVYIIFIIYYILKEISPLRVEISKIVFNTSLYESEKINTIKEGKIINKKKNSAKNPPKKNLKKSENRKSLIPTQKTSDESGLIVFKNQKRKNIKTKTSNIKKNNSRINNKMNELLANKKKNSEHIILNNGAKNKDIIKNIESENQLYDKNENLDNFELNNLDYDEACELDKRGFCRTYISVLMREHLLLLTFFTWHDYNLFYIKIERLLITICTEFTFNGLFFVHESMHRKYVEGENYTFVQKIPQILFTLIANHIIEVILCFFSMTDTHIYEIKVIAKKEKNGEKVVDIMNKIKNKLICFFVFTFMLFLFYWYFISAFCAVYQNTQKIFIRDSFISILTSFIDPLIIYGATTLLRYISLFGCCKKKLGCVYKLSDIIPFF